MPPLPTCFAARFELRLYQNHDLPPPASPGAGKAAPITAGRTSVAEMKETSIAMKSDCRADHVTRQIARIAFFQQPDSRILTQFEVHLAIAGIHGNHARRAVLQQAVSKASGGRAHIETDFSRDVDAPVFESALQLESAAADILQIFAEQANRALRRDLRSSFLDLLIVHQNFAREN